MSYSAMNIGFFAGYIMSGFFDYSNHYEPLFYISAIVNMLTIAFLTYSWRDLQDKHTHLSLISNYAEKRMKHLQGLAGVLLLIPVLIFCFNSAKVSNYLVMVTTGIMFFVILYLGYKQQQKADQQKIVAYLVLTVTSIIFWMIYYTGPMGVTLFIKNNVDKQWLGYEIPTQWILNINSLLIIVGAPLMVFIVNKLQSRGFTLSVTTQFIGAFLMLSVSFLFLSCAVIFADVIGHSSLNWVVLHFAAQSIAELLIGPVGYAIIGRIAPLKLQGILMGTWMMVSGVSASLSHFFSNAMVKAESLDPLLSNPDYLHVYNQLCVWALIGAVFLYCISGKIKRLIDGSMQERAYVDEQVVPL